ncbi:MAG: GGDEF domain-containing protein [Comamonadaceae bacterium]|nr:GGDEF domain-containing protein [Comamonadaceae bacterium]
MRDSEERYRSLSQTDPLTGLFNSRHMRELLPVEIDRAIRCGRPLALLALDCDTLEGRPAGKHGHLGGDGVLQTLANAIHQCSKLRRSDSAFRYGGEEFVVLLPEADGPAAMAIAERLRLDARQHPTDSPNGAVIACTVSIGVAHCRPDDNEMSVRRADEACYRAKRAGKNRVVLADSAA